MASLDLDKPPAGSAKNREEDGCSPKKRARRDRLVLCGVIDWGNLPWPSWFQVPAGPFPLSRTTLHKSLTTCTFMANRCKAFLHLSSCKLAQPRQQLRLL